MERVRRRSLARAQPPTVSISWYPRLCSNTLLVILFLQAGARLSPNSGFQSQSDGPMDLRGMARGRRVGKAKST